MQVAAAALVCSILDGANKQRHNMLYKIDPGENFRQFLSPSPS